MDTWAYPYRLPVFEKLSKQVKLNLFFSKPHPFDHLDKVLLSDFDVPSKSGRKCFAYMPIHLLWEKYDAYLVGQIGIQSTLGALLTTLVAKIRNKPLILWTDYIETEYYLKNKTVKRFFGDMVRRIFTSQCSAAMAFGKYTRSYLEKITQGRLKIFEVKQVVPEVCNPAPQSNQNKDKQRVVILYVGYLRKGKGLDTLIRAFKSLNRPEVVCILGGSGKEEAHLRQLASGIEDRVEFAGYIEGETKANLFASADIFVFPSNHDTWGLAINEAMYYGLPIIATSSSGAHELIDENGIVIPPCDEKALQTALEKLIDNKSLRIAMGEKSREIISHYGLDYGVNCFMKVINYVINDKNN